MEYRPLVDLKTLAHLSPGRATPPDDARRTHRKRGGTSRPSPRPTFPVQPLDDLKGQCRGGSHRSLGACDRRRSAADAQRDRRLGRLLPAHVV